MSRRVVIGTRSNGDVGVFVSPSGVDAYTASDSSLVLDISSKFSQLILLGHVSSSTTVSLGLSSQPVVFITTTGTNSVTGVNGTTTFPANAGPTRPSPVNPGDSGSSVTINSSGASMSLNLAAPATYAVYSTAF